MSENRVDKYHNHIKTTQSKNEEGDEMEKEEYIQNNNSNNNASNTNNGEEEEDLEEEIPEIEEHKPEEIKKAHEQYIVQQQQQQHAETVTKIDENKLSQHREASMEAVLDLAELEQVQREAERLKGLGNKHMAAHEYTRACNAYSAALQLAPVGPSSHVFLSNRSAALLSLKQYNAAALDAKRAVAMQPEYGKAHARFGQALYFSKDYAGAIEAYEEAVSLDPDNAVTWAYLAKARGKYAKYKHKTVSNNKDSISVMPTSPTSPEEILSPQSQPIAKTTHEHAADELRGPDREEASRLFLRGNHFNERREFQKAIDEYSAALFLCSDDPDISYHLYIGRAMAHNQLEMHDAASSDARMAVGLQAAADAYSTLGKSLFYLKDYRGAAIALEESLRLAIPNSTAANIDSAYLNKAYSELQSSSNSTSQTSSSVVSSPSRKAIPKLPPPRFVAREEAISHAPSLPPMPTNWPQQSLKASQFRVGPERVVTFGIGPMGIKLNRGPDGMIRVLSINAKTTSDQPATNRKGIIQVGDVVREAAGVDLRRPVTNIMWGDTVALIKLAPRPIDLIVAKELSAPPKAVLEEIKIAQKEDEEEQKINNSNVGRSVVDLPTVDVGEEKDDFDEEEQYYHPSPANGEEAVGESMNILFSECDDLELPDDEEEIDYGTELDSSADDDSAPVSDAIENIPAEHTEAEDVVTKPTPNTDDDDDHTPVPDATLDPAPIPDIEIDTTTVETIIETNHETKVVIDDDVSTTPKENTKEQESFIVLDEEPSPKEKTLSKTILFPQTLNGYSKEQWESSQSTSQIIHYSPILLQKTTQKLFSWWGGGTSSNYEPRTLVLYANPNIIVILRAPSHIQELKNLLPPQEWKQSSFSKDDYYIVESIIDPKMCKLRLSLFTSKTSHSLSKQQQQHSEGTIMQDIKKDTCFELITPLQTCIFSLLFDNTMEKDDTSIVYTHTLSWEIHLTISLLSSHPQSEENNYYSSNNNIWKHQIILGTLHSYILLGDYDGLEHALLYLSQTMDDASSIIDAVDDNDYTPLHYACIHRAHKAVHLLINYSADCTIPTMNGKTCLHLSAEKLDDKSLSTILSGTRAINPNGLDELDRTAMYVAIVDGKTVGGKSDSEALNRCLSALDVWGGEIFPSLEGGKNLLHPLHIVAKEWRFHDLSIVLSRCCPFTNTTFPLNKDHTNENISSIGYYYDYPIHFSLISFYENIIKFQSQKISVIMKEQQQTQQQQVQEISSFGALSDILFYQQYFDLSKTISILLEYGFEPNERCHSTSKHILMNNSDNYHLMLFHGFTPLQILAVIASYCQQIEDEDKLEMKDLLYHVIAQAAKVLVSYGSRISIPSPPTCNKKMDLRSSSGSIESLDGTTNHEIMQKIISDSGIDRSTLKLDDNHSLLAVLGGSEYLSQARNQWETTKTMVNPGSTAMRLQKDITPTLGTDKCCTICWKAFGKLLNRKHTCRASGRYICEECSTKRILILKDGYRISDGIYNLARKEKSIKHKRDVEANFRKKESRQNRIKELKEERFGSAATTTKKLEQNISKQDQDRNSLFGSLSKQVQNIFIEEVEDDESNPMERNKNNISGLANTMSQTRDAFLERGEKLNTLSDKTDALKDASKDFADMARELNDQQKGFFW